MRKFLILLLFATWGVLGLLPAQSQERSAPELEDFLGRLDFWGPELSPSGQFLSSVRRMGDETYLVVTDLDSNGAGPQMTKMGNVYLNWVEWITDERMILSVTGYVNARTGDWMSREELKQISGREYPVSFNRIMAVDRDGGNTAVMFSGDRAMSRNRGLGRVVSFLPEDPDHILMAARRSGDLDLFRLNVLDGSFKRIAQGTENTYSWYVDRNGEPAFRFNVNRRGTVIYIFAREDRANGKIKWRKIKTIRLKRNQSDEAATEFDPLFPGPSETTYYVAARPQNEDKTGIYLYDFEKDEFVDSIRTHESVDIYNALFNRETRELQGVFYYQDRLVLEFFDRDVQKHIDGLDVFFGGELNVWPMMSNKAGTRWLLRAVGPTDSGSYYIYDLTTNRTRYIGSNKTSLNDKALGSSQVVTFEARDGLSLSGYLTRPPNAPADQSLPLIMMPHGGPELRDVISFDYNVQVLVAHGYQVFQPNFRGSSGYGKRFADLGRRQWGKAMQTDVEDAFAHLVDIGLADADRACILGASYGGYVALAAATLTPDLYQCAIAIAAPSDLVAQVKWDGKQEGRDSETYKYWVEHIGDPRKDKDAMNAVSPAKLADRVTRPILLIHGEDDDVVPIEQSKIMAKALLKAEKYFAQVILDESDHSYRSDADERKEYEAILDFLATYLPTDTGGQNSSSALP